MLACQWESFNEKWIFISPLHLQEVFFSMKHNKTTYKSVKLIKKNIQFLNFNNKYVF